VLCDARPGWSLRGIEAGIVAGMVARATTEAITQYRKWSSILLGRSVSHAECQTPM
jgi:hypothetical protein